MKKQRIMTVEKAKMNKRPGLKYNPDTIPAHNGTTIRRNGISLFSTACR
jgi:hypothetical protein